MSKKIVAMFCLMFVVLACVPMTTKAANEMNKGYEFNVNYAEPSTSDNQGYVCIFTQNTTTGAYGLTTYFWNTLAVVNGYDSPSYAYLTFTDYTFEFTVGGSYNGASGYYSITQIDDVGYWWNIKNSSSERLTVDFGSQGKKILGFHYKGNVGHCNSFSINPFTVYFNQDASANLLRDLWDLVYGIWQLDWSILDALNNIGSSVDGVEAQLSSVIDYLKSVDSELDSIRSELQLIYQKADALLLEQKASNTWLEKIYNFFAEKDEKDKEAAIQQGNQSTSDVDNIVKDDSEGFKDSLGGLASSMSYSGTECSWTFPTVKLPAISGVMDEVTLITEREIDFAYWVNAIPSAILLLIRSVCTAALIVFCFKELYGTVEYALTLRKGGGS